MFHPTTFDAYVTSASITAAAAIYVGRKTRKTKEAVFDSKDLLVQMSGDVRDLRQAFQAHTEDDAQNFRELRQAVGGARRRRGLLPLLGVLVTLFMR